MAAALPAIYGALIATAVSFVLNKIGAHFTKPDRERQDEESQDRRLGNRVSTAEPRKIVFGRLRVGGPIIFDGVTNSSDQQTQYRHLCVVFAGHECEGIQEYYIDGKSLPLTSLDGDGLANAGEFSGYVRARGHNGEPGQIADIKLREAFAQWTADHRGASTCYSYFRFTRSEIFTAGLPNRMEAVIHGKKCYDPRLDSTVGGAGSHRQNDPATWAFTTNPALFTLYYHTDTVLGIGTPWAKIDIPSFAAAANRCDELIQLTGGGTTARYRGSAYLTTGENYSLNIRKLLALFDGVLLDVGEKIRLVAGGPSVAAITIDPSYLAGPVSFRTNKPTADTANIISGTFWDEAAAYQEVQYPPRTKTAYQTADGEPITRTISFPGVTSSARAQYLSKIELEKTRVEKQLVMPCNLKAFQVEPWAVVRVNLPELAIDDELYRVVDFRCNENTEGVTLQLEEYIGTVWDWAQATDYIPPLGVVTIDHDAPVVPSPADLAAASVAGGVALVWTNPPPDTYSHIDVLESADDDFTTAVKIHEVRSNFSQFGLGEGVTKFYWVQAVNYAGEKSPIDDEAPGVEATGGAAGSGGASITVANDPPASPNEGDLWFDADAGNHPYRWNGSSWVSLRDGAIADAQATADSKNSIYFQPTAPAGPHAIGDLWIDTDDGNRAYEWNGSAWVDAQDQEIVQALIDAANAQLTADGKALVYRQTSMPAGGTLGDIWIDTDDMNHMYVHNGSTWISVRDGAIAEALAEAEAAGTLADGKISSYWQSTPPVGAFLRNGDLWFDTDDDNKPHRYQGGTWIPVRDDLIADAIADAATAQATADGKIETFVQTSPPSAGVSNLGDLWFDSNSIPAYQLFRYNGSFWENVRDGGIQGAIDAAASAQSTADGKIDSWFQSSPPVGASEGDLWFDTDDQFKVYRYQGSSWVPARDTGIDQAILASNNANTAAGNAQSTADTKIRTYFQTSAPVGGLTSGDLWVDTDDNNRLYRWNGSSWVDARDSLIQAAVPSMLGCKPNYSTFGGIQPGRIYLHGYSDGGPADVDGATTSLGGIVSVPKGAIITSQVGQGVIIFNTTGSGVFSTSLGTKPYAYAWKRGNTWYYDNGSTSGGVTFSVTGFMRVIGTVSINTGGSVFNATAFSNSYSPDAIGASMGGRVPDQRSLNVVSNFNLGAIQTWIGGGNLITSSDNGASAKIDVKAHSVQWGSGLSTSYNAGTILGLSFETEYHLYCDDPNLAGGSVSYIATTNPSTIAASNDRYYVGTIVTAADGGGSTGGGTGAGCLEETMFAGLEPIANIKPGQTLPCLENGELETHPVQIVATPKTVPCVRITAGDSTIVVSVTTPIPLMDGGYVVARIIDGHHVAVLKDGSVSWQKCRAVPVGFKTVIPICLGGRSFAGSEKPGAQIITHNGVKGPDGVLPV